MRNMKTTAVYLLFALLGISGALAQPAAPSVESVTVNGKRIPDNEIRAFVETRVAPTRTLGKVARWERGICPIAMGLKPTDTQFIIKRLREVAAKVGAPVNATPGCTPNIEIDFTDNPQAVLDDTRQNHEDYLGYYGSNHQADALAKVTRPIQAWYASATIDSRGIPIRDSSKFAGAPHCLDPPKCYVFTSAEMVRAESSRLTDGLRSGLFNVIIVANPKRLGEAEIGTLADYITFLALAQARSLDDCESLPSILNFLASGCASATSTREISDSDLGYLRGIYHMTADAMLGMQQDEIAYQMKQTLGGH
jgi:hypothetical protein